MKLSAYVLGTEKPWKIDKVASRSRGGIVLVSKVKKQEVSCGVRLPLVNVTNYSYPAENNVPRFP
jgi:hypothetical protein